MLAARLGRAPSLETPPEVEVDAEVEGDLVLRQNHPGEDVTPPPTTPAEGSEVLSNH